MLVKMEEAARSRSTFCGAQLRPAERGCLASTRSTPTVESTLDRESVVKGLKVDFTSPRTTKLHARHE